MLTPSFFAAALIALPLAAGLLGTLPTLLAVMVEGPQQGRTSVRSVRL